MKMNRYANPETAVVAAGFLEYLRFINRSSPPGVELHPTICRELVAEKIGIVAGHEFNETEFVGRMIQHADWKQICEEANA